MRGEEKRGIGNKIRNNKCCIRNGRRRVKRRTRVGVGSFSCQKCSDIFTKETAMDFLFYDTENPITQYSSVKLLYVSENPFMVNFFILIIYVSSVNSSLS